MDTVTETEIILNLNLEEEILALKKKLNAVILAHYYQESEIQDLADFIGDSLELSKKAAATDADVIVFAGVHFMAETAKILNPTKKVLLPDLNAGCSLAEGCPAPLFKKFIDLHPDHIVISYINCSANVKALSDIICTSSNAVKIVEQLPPEQKIIFAPDRNLGKYIIKKTGRDMVLWEGSCIVHETFSDKKIIQLKLEYPEALLIAHPECEETLLNRADFIGSTSALLKFIEENPANEFIVATEEGIIYQMQKKCPEKKFIPAPPEENCACNQCPYMKLNTMEKLYLCMRDQKPEIILDEEIRLRALKPIQKMLEMSK
ncbi:MAG: quinolinate synthase NadA [Ignavibacteriae bacterium]|nr:MAG: quinolinate synthase NadA [Ignavibacteriota bacterium]